MIKVQGLTRSFGNCNCCPQVATLELRHGLGQWPVNTNITRLCKSCANELLNSLYDAIGNDVLNQHRIKVDKLDPIDKTSAGVICDPELENVFCKEYQKGGDGTAAPSSETMKEVEC